MKLVCRYCPTKVEHFKGLLEHIQEKHPELLKWFEIRNKKLKQVIISQSDSAERLCEIEGWNIKDCKVRILND